MEFFAEVVFVEESLAAARNADNVAFWMARLSVVWRQRFMRLTTFHDGSRWSTVRRRRRGRWSGTSGVAGVGADELFRGMGKVDAEFVGGHGDSGNVA